MNKLNDNFFLILSHGKLCLSKLYRFQVIHGERYCEVDLGEE